MEFQSSSCVCTPPVVASILFRVLAMAPSPPPVVAAVVADGIVQDGEGRRGRGNGEEAVTVVVSAPFLLLLLLLLLLLPNGPWQLPMVVPVSVLALVLQQLLILI